MDRFPKVAIIYLSFQSQPFIGRALDAIAKLTYPRERLGLFIVDNPHPVGGSGIACIQAELARRSDLPAVTVLPQPQNRGFSGGNNVGIKAALAAGFDYIYLHNQDGFMAPGCLEPIVSTLDNDPAIGAAQSLIMLYPETDRINSAGNCLHFLGFGYCGHFRALRPPRDLGHTSFPEQIGYASGAGLLLSAHVLNKHGLLDEDLFAYHEDLEYSLRLKSRGLRVALTPASVFYHEYAFARNAEKFYLMERNRQAVILMYYRSGTIALLLPALLAVEAGMLLIAWRGGWLKQKLRVYWYWLKIGHWSVWLKKRRAVQAARTVSDRVLLHDATAVIKFENILTQQVLVTKIANPLLAIYWKLVRKIL